MLRLIAFDVDGVLTDGSLVLGEKGEEYKIFHAHDGLGLVMLRKAGLHIAIISSRSSKIVAKRMASLGIDLVYQGQKEKRAAIIEIMQELEVSKDETAYVGDDLIDLPAMSAVGLAIAVADAQAAVLARADWITNKAGGRGAAREVCEMLLEAQGKREAAYQAYLVN